MANEIADVYLTIHTTGGQKIDSTGMHAEKADEISQIIRRGGEDWLVLRNFNNEQISIRVRDVSIIHER